MSNTADYKGGVGDEYRLEQLRRDLESNYEAVMMGMAPLALGSSDKELLEEFRAGMNTRMDIMLSVLCVVHSYDIRPLLPRVTVPCHIIQSSEDVCVTFAAAEYFHQHLDGKSIVEVLPVQSHLHQLIASGITNLVLLRHVHQDIN